MKSPFLRDQFATAAMQSLITASITEPGKVAHSDHIAKLAYVFADAMIEQREKKEVEDGSV